MRYDEMCETVRLYVKTLQYVNTKCYRWVMQCPDYQMRMSGVATLALKAEVTRKWAKI